MVHQEFWLRKRDNRLIDYKKFSQGRNSLRSEYPRLIKMDFSGTWCRPGFGVPKERINRPKLCFRVIRPRIITWKIIFRCLFIHLSFSFILLWFSISFGSFFIIFVLPLLTSIFLRGELNVFWNSIFSHLPFSIRHLIAYSPLENIFCLCP